MRRKNILPADKSRKRWWLKIPIFQLWNSESVFRIVLLKGGDTFKLMSNSMSEYCCHFQKWPLTFAYRYIHPTTIQNWCLLLSSYLRGALDWIGGLRPEKHFLKKPKKVPGKPQDHLTTSKDCLKILHKSWRCPHKSHFRTTFTSFKTSPIIPESSREHNLVVWFECWPLLGRETISGRMEKLMEGHLLTWPQVPPVCQDPQQIAKAKNHES